MSVLSILHLSDWHCCPSNNGSATFPQFNNLVQAIKRIGHVDLLVITGDFAHQGCLEGDSNKARRDRIIEWIVNIQDACKVTKYRTVLVPGNHDVVRERQSTAAMCILKMLQQPNPDLVIEESVEDLLKPAFQNVYNIIRQHSLFRKLDDLCEGYEDIEIARIPIRLIAVNTALVAGSPDDGKDDKDIRGTRIIRKEKLLNALDMRDRLPIVVSHYPLDWIHNCQGDEIRERLATAGALYLHGHVHAQKAIQDDTAGIFKILTVGSAAICGGGWKGDKGDNSFHLLRINPEAGRIYRREWLWKSPEWKCIQNETTIGMGWVNAWKNRNRQISSKKSNRPIKDNKIVVQDDASLTFSYEKEIIDYYIKNKKNNSHSNPATILPSEWPKVIRRDVKKGYENKKVMPRRDENISDPSELVSPNSWQVRDLLSKKMWFPLAGPRKKLYHPSKPNSFLRVAIVVSGGIAPGTNAVISAIVERHNHYFRMQDRDYKLLVYGAFDGFRSLSRGGESVLIPIEINRIRGYSKEGGCYIGTSRVPECIEKDKRQETFNNVIDSLVIGNINILYVIGGDGTMRAARTLSDTMQKRGIDISVVAIPKTMDNDVLWGWQTFGFETATAKADEMIRDLHTEAISNPRLGVVQLFGSDSGYVTTHTALSCGVCDLFLIPEVPFSMQVVGKYLADKLRRYAEEQKSETKTLRTKGIVIMAETSIPIDAMRYISGKYKSVKLTQAEQKEVEKHLHVRLHKIKEIEDFNLDQRDKTDVYGFLGLNNKKVEPKDLSKGARNAIRKYGKNLRCDGQTSDDLRSVGIKLVEGVVKEEIRKTIPKDDFWKQFRVFVNQPRHLIRAVPPSSSDFLFCNRLGTLAVDGAMAGYTGFMISQWLTEYVMVPLELVTVGRKRVPVEGIFYRTAVTATGQPEDPLFNERKDNICVGNIESK